MKPTLIVFGANGFIGRYVTRYYARRGWEVVAVARSQKGWSGDGMFLEWDGKSLGPWAEALEGSAAVINLAGRSVNCRYDEANRRAIMDSRVNSTRVIGAAIAACKVPPKVWLNSSTATLYRHAEDHAQDEWLGEPGSGFSVEVAQAWEQAFFAMKTPGATRKVALRTSLVLANEAGTVYDVLAKLARCGLGGRQGGGQQKVSWIHIGDFLRALDLLLEDPQFDGVVNMAAPEVVENRVWMSAFRETVGMPVGLPAARWMLELGAWMLGTETELVLKSRWIDSRRLRESGFSCRWPRLQDALLDLQARQGLESFFREPECRSMGAHAWAR